MTTIVRHLHICCAALLVLLPAAGEAQELSSVDDLLERGRRAGVDPVLLERVTRRARHRGIAADQTAALLEPAVDLAENELPARLVLQKALEGLAKNVPGPRIQPVLQQIRTHTEDAGAFIEHWAARTDVQEMLGSSSASSADFSREEKQHLVESAVQARMQRDGYPLVRELLTDLPDQTSRRPIPTQNIAAALRILPDLPGGSPRETGSRQLLTAVLEAGYEPDDIQQFPAAIRSAVNETDQPPERLTHGAAAQVAKGRPAAEVLNGLFSGQVPGGPPGQLGNTPPESAPPGQGQTPGEEQGQRPPGANGPPDDRGNAGSGPPGDNGPGENGPPDDRGPDNGGPPDNRGPDGGGPPDDRGPGNGSPPDDRGPGENGPPDNRGPDGGGPPDDRGPDNGGPPDDRGPGENGPPDGRGPGGSGDDGRGGPGSGNGPPGNDNRGRRGPDRGNS